MPTNDLADENDCGTASRPPTSEITSTFTETDTVDEWTDHLDVTDHSRRQRIAAGISYVAEDRQHRSLVMEYDHRRVEYVYADADGDLTIQARYYHHGELEHVHEDTFDLDANETPLEYARQSYDRNPPGSVTDEFELMVGCGRPLYPRLRDLRDRLRIRAKSALAAALGGA